MSTEDYVLLTAARNEETLIADTARVVLAQSRRPLRWLICVNGSTDSTEQIARRLAEEHALISVITMDGDTPRSFASKAHAINLAYEQAQTSAFGYVGVLDADMRPEPDCYEQLLRCMQEEPRRGLMVGWMVEPRGMEIDRLVAPPPESTWGAQFFRRACFEEIGGYRPLRWGGLDVLAALMAREAGWDTGTCLDARIGHVRGMGSHQGRELCATQYRYGIRDQKLGMHPLYCLAKAVNRLRNRPAVVGSLAFMGGFLSGCLRRADPQIPPSCRRRMREEQKRTLRDRSRGQGRMA